RRASTVADDLDFLLLIDMLKIAVIHSFLAELGQQPDRERGVEISKRGSDITIFEHHALSKAGSGIVVAQSGKRLDGIEIEFFFFDDLLNRDIKTDRS